MSDAEFSQGKGTRYPYPVWEYVPGDLVRVIPYHGEPIGTVVHRKVSAQGNYLNHYDILVGGELVGFHALSLRRVKEMK